MGTLFVCLFVFEKQFHRFRLNIGYKVLAFNAMILKRNDVSTTAFVVVAPIRKIWPVKKRILSTAIRKSHARAIFSTKLPTSNVCIVPNAIQMWYALLLQFK